MQMADRYNITGTSYPDKTSATLRSCTVTSDKECFCCQQYSGILELQNTQWGNTILSTGKSERLVRKHLPSRFLSSYRKSLLKKFMFQVHPDFFHNHKALQQINATNLSALQDLLNDDHTTGTGIQSSLTRTKSLTFYLKPELSNSKPQQVKVSVPRVENSIMEILETIGVGLPVNQSDESHFNSTRCTMLATAKQTLDFLNSMYERRNLIDWREQRCIDLVAIEKTFLEITGATRVDYRNSWSAHNNSIILSRLCSLILQNRDTIELPWTNIIVLFTKEDCEQRIDYLERTIYLASSDVPEQILSVLQAVRLRDIENSQVLIHQIQCLKKMFESQITTIISHELLEAASRFEHDRINVSVIVRKGFTCSMINFYYFLHTMNDGVFCTDNSNRLNSSQNFNEFDGYDSYGLKNKPMQIFVTVEDAHGTLLLDDGSFRIDARADKAVVYDLLVKGTGELLKMTETYRQRARETSELVISISAELGITSISYAAGVNVDQFLTCLRRLNSYIKISPTRKALLQLRGLRVLVGHYLGLSNDGAVILPWDTVLPIN